MARMLQSALAPPWRSPLPALAGSAAAELARSQPGTGMGMSSKKQLKASTGPVCLEPASHLASGVSQLPRDLPRELTCKVLNPLQLRCVPEPPRLPALPMLKPQIHDLPPCFWLNPTLNNSRGRTRAETQRVPGNQPALPSWHLELTPCRASGLGISLLSSQRARSPSLLTIFPAHCQHVYPGRPGQSTDPTSSHLLAPKWEPCGPGGCHTRQPAPACLWH